MRRRFHFAFVVAAVAFVAFVLSAGVRGAAGVLLLPLTEEFGWDRATVSLAFAVSILAYGLGGPLGGSLVDRFGPRRVLLVGTAAIVVGLVAMTQIRELWQLHLWWGLVLGVGTGAVSSVVGTTIAHRWFRTHRGLVIGLFGAAGSAGQLVFIPAMSQLTVDDGWRAGILLLAVGGVLTLLILLPFMRDAPADVGAKPYGEGATVSAAERTADARRTPLAKALRTTDFWLLAGSFFICGYTSNGLVGTHLIPHAIDHGFSAVTAAGAVGLMGAMNIVGTLGSGWLSDRVDNRKLLAAYYGFRALSIAWLPFIYQFQWLLAFAVVYGLDWIATVPPTANLTAARFGRASLGTLYGWIFFAHMAGAAIAAYAGGFFRDLLGDYHLIFISATALGVIAVGLALRISESGKRVELDATPEAAAAY